MNVGGNIGVPLSSINQRVKDKGITIEEAKREGVAVHSASVLARENRRNHPPGAQIVYVRSSVAGPLAKGSLEMRESEDGRGHLQSQPHAGEVDALGRGDRQFGEDRAEAAGDQSPEFAASS